MGMTRKTIIILFFVSSRVISFSILETVVIIDLLTLPKYIG